VTACLLYYIPAKKSSEKDEKRKFAVLHKNQDDYAKSMYAE
jgi:hypothetical protein